MDAIQVIDFAHKIAAQRGAELPDINEDWFAWAHAVSAVAKDAAHTYELREWAKHFRKLYDRFDQEVAADPIIVYRPKNWAAEAFHKSQAFIRYFRAGNRTSKTQSGIIEHAWIVTHRHPYRKLRSGPHKTFIVTGLDFSTYVDGTFEPKFLTGGDGGNPLAPLFPEDGKWFNHYDSRQRVIRIACPDCANKGRSKQCSHPKSEIKLFADTKGHHVIEAFSATMFHFDEHVSEEFFPAAKMRVADQNGFGIVTATPLFGPDAWEIDQLAKVAEGPPQLNLSIVNDPDSPPYVEMWTISQYEGNIVPHHVVDRERERMDDFEVEARIFGRPAVQAKNPVFDRQILSEMRDKSTPPLCIGSLTSEKLLEEVTSDEDLRFEEGGGFLSVWEEPEPEGVYVVAVDTARGLTNRDASCATVLKIEPRGYTYQIRMVAQIYGWLPTFDYGYEIFKVAVWYNSALVVIELTGGFGEAVLQVLNRTLCYWNIFRDDMGAARADHGLDPRLGVDTNAASKPFMVSTTQQILRDRMLSVPCRATINEMANFQQEVSDSGKTTQFRGAGKAHDDRVMSIVIGVSVIVKYSVFDFMSEYTRGDYPDKELSPEWKEIHEEIKRSQEMDPFAP